MIDNTYKPSTSLSDKIPAQIKEKRPQVSLWRIRYLQLITSERGKFQFSFIERLWVSQNGLHVCLFSVCFWISFFFFGACVYFYSPQQSEREHEVGWGGRYRRSRGSERLWSKYIVLKMKHKTQAIFKDHKFCGVVLNLQFYFTTFTEHFPNEMYLFDFNLPIISYYFALNYHIYIHNLFYTSY